MITAKSTPNIALIKYWGNSNDELRLCANDNLAMTLDGPHIEVGVDHADVLSVNSTTLDKPKELNQSQIDRFDNHIKLCQQYLAHLGVPSTLPGSLKIVINSQIPPAIGLASSAAVFSAVAKAISGLVAEHIKLTDEQISVLARLGSGSAARSIFGGYGAVKIDGGDAIDSAVAWQIADANHWQLHDIILVPSIEEKKVGSTQGHPGARTSPHFKERLQTIQDYRQPEAIDAILNKDFEKLRHVAELDCMNMHEMIMQQQNPPLNYLSDTTYRIIDEITELREVKHLPVLYTMDAGPTVHLFCTNEAKDAVMTYANEQKDCQVFATQAGEGCQLLT